MHLGFPEGGLRGGYPSAGRLDQRRGAVLFARQGAQEASGAGSNPITLLLLTVWHWERFAAVNRKKGEQALGNSAVYAGCAACGGWRQPTGGFGMQSGVAICMWFWTAVFRVTGRYNVSSGYSFVDAV